MSIIAHYRLDGDGVDQINGYNATTITNVTWDTGKINQAAGFDRSLTSYITIDNFPATSERVSVAAWIYLEAEPDGTQYGAIAHHGLSGGAAFSRFSFYVMPDRELRGWMSDGASAPDYGTGYFIPLNQWRHVVFTYEDKTVRVYVDGEKITTVTLTMTQINRSSSTRPLHIGDYAASGNYTFPGRIDDVRVYDHVLSHREVADLSHGIVTHLTMEAEVDSADQGGYISGSNAVYAEGAALGVLCYENDAAAARSFVVVDKPTTIDSQTIAMWLYPTSYANRMNPYNQNYGGEGTMTHETSGNINYYWGTNGGNSSPYQTFPLGTSLPLNQWTHVAVVRDLEAGALYWYVNGEQTNTESANYAQAAVSSSNLTIGNGYTNPYAGRIDDVRVYCTALTASQVKDLYEIKGSVTDTGGLSAVSWKESINPNIEAWRPTSAVASTWLVTEFPEDNPIDANGVEKYINAIANTDLTKWNTYNFYAPKDGDYLVQIYHLSVDSSTDSVHVSVDNEAFVYLDFPASGVWQWTTYATKTLSKGYHNIRLATREDGTKISLIGITTDSGTTRVIPQYAITAAGSAMYGTFSEVGIMDGIESWLPFDSDLREYSQNLTVTDINNSMTINDNGWYFNGSNSALRIDNLDIANGGWTISAVLYIEDAADYTHILTAEPGQAGGVYKIGTNTNTLPRRPYFYSVGTGSLVSDTTISNQTWYHLALTFDGVDTLKFYLDGVPDGEFVDANLPSAMQATSYNIGRNPNDGTPSEYNAFNLRDHRVYSRALSGEEIAALAEHELQQIPSMKQTQNGTVTKANISEY